MLEEFCGIGMNRVKDVNTVVDETKKRPLKEGQMVVNVVKII